MMPKTRDEGELNSIPTFKQFCNDMNEACNHYCLPVFIYITYLFFCCTFREKKKSFAYTQCAAQIMTIVHHGPVKTLVFNRLRLLEAR